MPISRGKFKALVANPIPKVMASSQLQKRGVYFKEFIDDDDDLKSLNILIFKLILVPKELSHSFL